MLKPLESLDPEKIEPVEAKPEEPTPATDKEPKSTWEPGYYVGPYTPAN